MIIIKFFGDKKSIEIDAETIGEAVETALSNGADLSWADLSGADLRGADLSGVDLSGACLRDANLRHADLSWANLSWANLHRADLSWADLSDANLHRADLSWADLSWADLSWADLSGADLCDANLHRADLDYSCFPIWCGSLAVKIDKRVFCQLLYHTLRAGQSVDDPEVKKLFAIPEVVALANQFHRVEECGKIKTESEADDE